MVGDTKRTVITLRRYTTKRHDVIGSCMRSLTFCNDTDVGPRVQRKEVGGATENVMKSDR